MTSNRNLVLHPPLRHIEAFQSVRDRAHPELKNAWHVALYLRRKELSRDDVRDTDPAPYRAVVQRVLERGGTVLCGGDYDPHEIFPDLNGIYGYSDFSCSRTLCDLFFITQCRFMVGPHSGPTALSSAFDIPKLITDCPFTFLSGLRARQISLYRTFRDAKTSRILTAREMFSPPVVMMSQTPQYRAAEIDVLANTEGELVAGLEEILGYIIDGKSWALTADDAALVARFRRLLPSNAVAEWSPSRPALSWLRNVRWE